MALRPAAATDASGDIVVGGQTTRAAFRSGNPPRYSVRVAGKLPAGTPTGSYRLVVTATPSAGIGGRPALENADTSNDTASSAASPLDPPRNDLSISDAKATLPVRLKPGSTGHVMLSLFNGGNVTANTQVALQVTATVAGGGTQTLGSRQLDLSIPPSATVERVFVKIVPPLGLNNLSTLSDIKVSLITPDSFVESTQGSNAHTHTFALSSLSGLAAQRIVRPTDGAISFDPTYNPATADDTSPGYDGKMLVFSATVTNSGFAPVSGRVQAQLVGYKLNSDGSRSSRKTVFGTVASSIQLGLDDGSTPAPQTTNQPSSTTLIGAFKAPKQFNPSSYGFGIQLVSLTNSLKAEQNADLELNSDTAFNGATPAAYFGFTSPLNLTKTIDLPGSGVNGRINVKGTFDNGRPGTYAISLPANSNKGNFTLVFNDAPGKPLKTSLTVLLIESREQLSSTNLQFELGIQEKQNNVFAELDTSLGSFTVTFS